MSVFVLKIIACTAMFLDHIKYANPIFNNFFTEYFGRLALPIFAFLIAEGYSHTSDLNKYIKRIFIFGVISQICIQMQSQYGASCLLRLPVVRFQVSILHKVH